MAEKLLKIPFVRGALVLYESMQNGYAALQFSAEQYEQEIALVRSSLEEIGAEHWFEFLEAWEA